MARSPHDVAAMEMQGGRECRVLVIRLNERLTGGPAVGMANHVYTPDHYIGRVLTQELDDGENLCPGW